MIDVRRTLTVTLLALGLLVTACSPEAMRKRDGGPGGDVGNRGRVVDMHGEQSPYYQTPRLGVTASRQ
jgi:hypothetical protein